MTYKKWLVFLKTAPEAVYRVKLGLINNQEVLLNLEKKIVKAKDKTIGFVLINQKLTLSEVFKDTVHIDYKKRLKVFFDLLDEPVAHFDQEKNKYILSSQMVRI
jgi:hypothetical protein